MLGQSGFPSPPATPLQASEKHGGGSSRTTKRRGTSARPTGEDSGSKQIDDAKHWLEVYTELLSFKRDLLRNTYEHMAGMQVDAARTEVRQTDELVLEAEAQRFERRRKFWEQRLQELSED
jgi:hypothetical protein